MKIKTISKHRADYCTCFVFKAALWDTLSKLGLQLSLIISRITLHPRGVRRAAVDVTQVSASRLVKWAHYDGDTEHEQRNVLFFLLRVAIPDASECPGTLPPLVCWGGAACQLIAANEKHKLQRVSGTVVPAKHIYAKHVVNTRARPPPVRTDSWAHLNELRSS